MLTGETFSSQLLSVVEVDCSYTTERSRILPVILFNGMDEPAQVPDDVDRFLVRPLEKEFLCFPECVGEIYAVAVTILQELS